MTERFPGVAIGIVDAMPAKGWAYQDIYRQLQAALTTRGSSLPSSTLTFPRSPPRPAGSISERSKISCAAS